MLSNIYSHSLWKGCKKNNSSNPTSRQVIKEVKSMTESLLREKNKLWPDSSRLRRLLLDFDGTELKNMQNTSVVVENKESAQKLSSEEITVGTNSENKTEDVEKSQLERDMAEIHGEGHTEGEETVEATTSKGDSELLKQLEDVSDDDSDDGKLHIAEEPEECQKAKVVENVEDDDVKVLYDNGCPFDCCTKGLTHKLYQISDRINHEIFKRTQEIENGILLKAGHPELVIPTHFDDYWKNVQNAGDEEIVVDPVRENENEDNMGNFDENSLHAYYPNVEIHCDEEPSLKNDFKAKETDFQVEKEPEENNIPVPVIQIREEKSGARRKEVTPKSINYLNAVSCIATDEEEFRVIKRNSSVFPIDAVQLPPKKRGNIYRPWSGHLVLPKNHCVEIQHITNQLYMGVSDQGRQMAEHVVDLSQIQAKHASNAISTNKDFIKFETSDTNSKYAHWQKTRNHFSSLLEKYSHITSLENGNRIYMCKMCYTTLKSEDEIKAHLYCQGVTKRVHCYLCRQDFTKESYRQHLEHHDAHPAALKCKPCGIVFDNFVAKSEHQKAHHRGDNMRERESGNATKEFPNILCYLCGREFRTAKAATSHFLSHINGYPFPCNFCNHWFKGIETAVTRFVLRHNGGNTFMCGIDPMLYTGILHGDSNA